jgi:F420 biosynthesis protein FbiB-like protein
MSTYPDTLKERRSIRKYAQDPVPIKMLEELVKAASYAPSAHNAQPWRFIIITDPKQKESLSEAMAQAWLDDLERDHVSDSERRLKVRASVERFTTPPAVIVVCMTMADMSRYPDADRQRAERDLAVQSLGAAIQNFLLEAHAIGLGACWFCAPAFCKSAVRRALGIPDEVEPQALITLGYPAETPSMPSRLALENFAFFNEWGSPL